MENLENLMIGFENFIKTFERAKEAKDLEILLNLLGNVAVLEYRSKDFNELYYKVQGLKEDIKALIIEFSK